MYNRLLFDFIVLLKMPSTDIQTDRKNLLNVEQNVHFPFFLNRIVKTVSLLHVFIFVL